MEHPAPRPLVYHLLLLCLLLLFPLHALAFTMGGMGTFALAMGNGVILVGCMIALNRGWMRYVAMGLGIPALLISLLFDSHTDVSEISVGALSITIYLFMIAVLTRTVFRRKHFQLQDVSAALSIYLLLGLLWAKLYGVVYILNENAFAVGEGIEAAGQSGLFYFSFVTITTLGYGDISPISPIAMSLATLEAIVGQFFMVVGVATVVAHAGKRSRDDQK